VNALKDDKVAEFVNENFIATYLKVGTFQIVNGQKQGGNVASYFCLGDGAVVHAVPGAVNARTFLSEARWAIETRKSALTLSTKLATGDLDMAKYHAQVKQAHEERYRAETGNGHVLKPRGVKNGAPAQAKAKQPAVPQQLPQGVSQQAQVHWMLAMSPLAPIEEVYPVVWERVLREQLSGLPVVQR
jgi:hypothetical protein